MSFRPVWRAGALTASFIFVSSVASQAVATTVMSSSATLSNMGVTVTALDALPPGALPNGPGYRVSVANAVDPEAPVQGLYAEVSVLREGEQPVSNDTTQAISPSSFWPTPTGPVEVRSEDGVVRSFISRQTIDNRLDMSDVQFGEVLQQAYDSINITQHSAFAGLWGNENFLVTVAPRTRVNFHADFEVHAFLDAVAIEQLRQSLVPEMSLNLGVSGGAMFIGDTTLDPGQGYSLLLNYGELTDLPEVLRYDGQPQALSFDFVNEGDTEVTLPFTYRLMADNHISVANLGFSAVPEPASWAFMGLGLAGLGALSGTAQLRRRHRLA
jgi:hypothetical protein